MSYNVGHSIVFTKRVEQKVQSTLYDIGTSIKFVMYAGQLSSPYPTVI